MSSFVRKDLVTVQGENAIQLRTKPGIDQVKRLIKNGSVQKPNLSAYCGRCNLTHPENALPVVGRQTFVETEIGLRGWVEHSPFPLGAKWRPIR